MLMLGSVKGRCQTGYVVGTEMTLILTTNLFFMKIPWKCVQKPMNPFHGHENSDFGFHGAKLSHEISK